MSLCSWHIFVCTFASIENHPVCLELSTPPPNLTSAIVPHSCSLQCRLRRISETLGLPPLSSILLFLPLSSALSPFLPTRFYSPCFFVTVPLSTNIPQTLGWPQNCPLVSDSPKSASYGQVWMLYHQLTACPISKSLAVDVLFELQSLLFKWLSQMVVAVLLK